MTKLQENTEGTRRNKTDYSMIPREDEVIELTDKEELFMQYYMHNSETRYNATWAYNYAYNRGLEEIPQNIEVIIDKKKQTQENPEYRRVRALCSVAGSKLLVKPKINARKIQLATQNLQNNVVDSELSGVIMQNKELAPKMKAIQEYNKLNQRIVDKVDIRTTSIGIVKHVYEKADKGTVRDV